MRFICDGNPRSFKLLDDNGEEILNAPISGVDIELRPDESKATIYVDFPGCDIELSQDDVTLKTSCKLVWRDDA